MNYLSVCSGIESATVAWHPLGWKPIAFAEIERFPSAVLAHHYPHVPNWGDITRFQEWPDANVDLLVAGTPCQAFSVAGLRKGLDDPRGNLTLTFLAIAARYRPRWVVWENVPGVFSDDTGAFGALLSGLAELGYLGAYRVMDAQYFGVAQRRRRPLVVGYLGDWRRAAAVLFERESMSGNPAPRREAGERAAPSLAARTRGGGGLGTDTELDGGLIASLTNLGHHGYPSDRGDGAHLVPEVSPAIKARDYKGPSSDGDGDGACLVPVAMNLRGREGGAMPELDDVASVRAASGGSSRSYVAFSCKDHGADAGDLAPTLRGMGHAESHANAGGQVAVAFDQYNASEGAVMHTMAGCDHHNRRPSVREGLRVRRLTPRECERLMGFPDDYTLIPYNGKPAKDGPRYKALGNSKVVPKIRWLGERIAAVDLLSS